MEKIFKLGQYFANTYEPVMQLVNLEVTEANTKIASEALEYIKDVKPKKGKTYVLVIAMGADDNWGSNRNGDGFPEKDLKKNYKNFETKFDKEGKIAGGALIFKHHRNKIAKGHPFYGTVKKAFYNDNMHRVELLLEVDNKKAPDIVEKIANGEFPAVSMGVKIPYDECSICGNKAEKIANYCDHLKYEMNRIYPSGKKAYAINGNYDYEKHASPLNFFDISFVFKPADQTGYMIKKVANVQETEMGSAALAEKIAKEQKRNDDLNKLSEILKRLKGTVGAVKDSDGNLEIIDKARKHGLDNAVEQMEPLSEDIVEKLSMFPMNEIISTLDDNNIMLTTPEFMKLTLHKLGHKKVANDILAMGTLAQPYILKHLADNPTEFESYAQLPMFQKSASNQRIVEIIETIKENRDVSEQGIVKKADMQFLRSVADVGTMFPNSGFAEGMTETEEIVGPDGKVYAVSRDAIEEAQFWKALRNAGVAFGSSAALAGMYAYLKANKGMINTTMAPVALVASALMGLKGVKDFVSRQELGEIPTTSGMKVPQETLMMQKQNGLQKSAGVMGRIFGKEGINAGHIIGPLLPIGATAGLYRYYQDKLKKGTAGQYNTELGKMLDNVGSAAYYHPYITGGSLLALGGAANASRSAIKKWLKEARV